MRTKLSDVARRAGVSAMTVSNVINGRFGQMRLATRHAVEEAIRELAYRPHAAGRSLRLDERLSVGMLVIDEAPAFLSDPFTAHLIAGMTNFLSSKGYGVVVQGVKPNDFENSVFVSKFSTDGLGILMSGPPDSYPQRIRSIASLGQPTVLFEVKLEEEYENVCSVRQDNFGGGESIARHLIENGARRFLIVLPRLSWPAILERQRGIMSVLGQSRDVHIDVALCDEDLGATQAAVRSKIDTSQIPDAIIGGNDQMAIAAMNLLTKRGIRVPEDVIVTGFNAFEFRYYANPLLTSVVSPVQQMGVRAAEELLRKIKTGSFSERDIVFSTELVVGDSSRRKCEDVTADSKACRPGS